MGERDHISNEVDGETKKPKRTQVKTISEFWVIHRFLYFFISLLKLVVEFFYLYYGSKVIIKEYNIETCDGYLHHNRNEDHPELEVSEEIVTVNMENANSLKRVSLALLAVHAYNVVRVGQRIYAKMFTVKEKASILKCILVDCYFCIALMTFIASQYLYFTWRKQCEISLKGLRKWLLWEVYYQYGIIAIYFILSCIVITYIVIQNQMIGKKDQKKKIKMQETERAINRERSNSDMSTTAVGTTSATKARNPKFVDKRSSLLSHQADLESQEQNRTSDLDKKNDPNKLNPGPQQKVVKKKKKVKRADAKKYKKYRQEAFTQLKNIDSKIPQKKTTTTTGDQQLVEGGQFSSTEQQQNNTIPPQFRTPERSKSDLNQYNRCSDDLEMLNNVISRSFVSNLNKSQELFPIDNQSEKLQGTKLLQNEQLSHLYQDLNKTDNEIGSFCLNKDGRLTIGLPHKKNEDILFDNPFLKPPKEQKKQNIIAFPNNDYWNINKTKITTNPFLKSPITSGNYKLFDQSSCLSGSSARKNVEEFSPVAFIKQEPSNPQITELSNDQIELLAIQRANRI